MTGGRDEAPSHEGPSSDAQVQQAQKLESLATLTGGIAREFNNILAHIAGHVELARAEALPDQSLTPHLDEIDRAQRRATDLVKRLLLFSHPQNATRTAAPLVPVIQEALGLLQRGLPPTIQVRTAFAEHLPLAVVDAFQVQQVILNLGANAGDAMRGQSGVLSVTVDRAEVADGRVFTPAIQPGTYLRVTVQDTGIGMASVVMERIFEPFFSTKGAEGTGLGLSTAHGIVRDHEGAITVASTPGVGTTFRVYIPAAAAATSAAVADRDEVVRGHGEHVLYVDDEEGLAHVMTRMLGALGYRCTACCSPRQAIELFRADPAGFDAVLTDLAMPDITGLELVDMVRGIRPDIPVGVVTGYDRNDADAIARANIAVRLPKPTPTPELSRGLRDMLQGGDRTAG